MSVYAEKRKCIATGYWIAEAMKDGRTIKLRATSEAFDD
jgi:hypothetical protein